MTHAINMVLDLICMSKETRVDLKFLWTYKLEKKIVSVILFLEYGFKIQRGCCCYHLHLLLQYPIFSRLYIEETLKQ